MAEVITALGLVASAVQLIDVGGRIVVKLSRFCSDLQKVPHKVKRAKDQVEQLVSLLQMINADLGAPDTGPLSTLAGRPSTNHLAIASNIIRDSLDQAGELSAILESLEPTEDRLLKRKWRAFVSLKKEEDIVERCDRLESLKSSLQVWYGHQSMLLLNEQVFRVSNLETSLATIRNEQRVALRENERLAANLRLYHRDINKDVLTSEDLQHVCNAMLFRPPSFGKAVCSTKTYQQATVFISQISSQEHHGTFDTGTEVGRNTRNKNTNRESRGQQPQLKNCKCTSVRSTIRPVPAYLQVFFESQSHHSNCNQRVTSYAFGARFVLLWLLGKSVEISFRMDTSSQKLIFGQNITTKNIVDRSKSPAFIAIDTARHDLWVLFDLNDAQYQKAGDVSVGLKKDGRIVQHVKRLRGTDPTDFVVEACRPRKALKAQKILEEVCAKLDSCIRSKEASPRDQDDQGVTFLHEIVRLAMNLLCLQEELRPTITSTVNLLVQHGVDVDAHMERPYGFSPTAWTGTALSWVVKILELDHFGHYLTNLSLDHVLEEEGCSLSETMSPAYLSQGGAQFFLRHPSLALGWKYSRLSTSLFSRSEPILRSALRSPTTLLEIQGEAGTVSTCFALGWPTGLKLILEAGADSSIIVHQAIRQEDLECLKMLLDHNCPMFAVPKPAPGSIWAKAPGDSLIEYAMSISASEKLLELLIDTLVQRRQRLVQLAIDNLHLLPPEMVQLIKPEEPHEVLDNGARSLYLALREVIDVPTCLWPGQRATVYHSEYLQISFAQQLYDAGFCDVNVQDESGYTPLALMIGTHKSHSESASWLLDKGAEGRLGLKADMPNCPHILAHCKNEQLLECPDTNHSLHLEEFEPLGRVCNIEESDSCFCYCSSSGCTPISILLRRTNSKRNRFKMSWLLELPDDISEYLTMTKECFANICRLEIFERLGMTHVCCRTMDATCWPTPYSCRRRSDLYWKDEDRREVQADESEFREILESYMLLYYKLMEDSQVSFGSSWFSWWNAMEFCLPGSSLGSFSPSSSSVSSRSSGDSLPLTTFSGRSLVNRRRDPLGEGFTPTVRRSSRISSDEEPESVEQSEVSVSLEHSGFGPDNDFRKRFLSLTKREERPIVEQEDRRNSWETASDSNSTNSYGSEPEVIVISEGGHWIGSEGRDINGVVGNSSESAAVVSLDAEDSDSDDTESTDSSLEYQKFYRRRTFHTVDPCTGQTGYSIFSVGRSI